MVEGARIKFGLRVPLAVTSQCGRNYGQLKDFEDYAASQARHANGSANGSAGKGKKKKKKKTPARTTPWSKALEVVRNPDSDPVDVVHAMETIQQGW
jgi:hypothetical protein